MNSTKVHSNVNSGNKDSFELAVRPLMEWLAENVHPHHVVMVTATSAELLEGEKVYNTNDFLLD